MDTLSSYNSPTSVPRAEITGTRRRRNFSTGVTRATRVAAFRVCNLRTRATNKETRHLAVDQDVSWVQYVLFQGFSINRLSNLRGLVIYVGCRGRSRKSVVERSFRTSLVFPRVGRTFVA